MTLDEYNENKNKDIVVYYELMGNIMQEHISSLQHYANNIESYMGIISNYYLSEDEANLKYYLRKRKLLLEAKESLSDKLQSVQNNLKKLEQRYEYLSEIYPEYLIF